MELKKRVLVGMLALFTSVCAFMPSVGASSSGGDEYVPYGDGGVGGQARDSLAGPAFRLLPPSQATLFALAKHGTARDILDTLGNNRALIDCRDDEGNLVWDILITNGKYRVLGDILKDRSNAGLNTFLKNKFKRYLKNWDTRRVPSNVLNALKQNVPDDIKRDFPFLSRAWI